MNLSPSPDISLLKYRILYERRYWTGILIILGVIFIIFSLSEISLLSGIVLIVLGAIYGILTIFAGRKIKQLKVRLSNK